MSDIDIGTVTGLDQFMMYLLLYYKFPPSLGMRKVFSYIEKSCHKRTIPATKLGMCSYH